MNDELVVLLNGVVAGRIVRERGAELRLEYDPDWVDSPGGYPLSLSLPRSGRVHRGDAVANYLEGLLPDNDAILAEWGRRFSVSPRNAFALLAHVGEDCAGAVQFARADRVDAVRDAAGGSVTWLSEREVAQRLRDLARDPAAWRVPADSGYFSLAGAQRKTALLWEDGRWGVPSGRVPTTHILKPPMVGYAGFAENEHLCLDLADRVGLPAARSQVLRFENQVVIAVERYDRVRVDGALVRVHQEDCCQALGLSPRSKYEAEGGPGVPVLVAFLRRLATDGAADAGRLVDSVALNWAIGGTDAHAKNYSLLIGAREQVFLAPLYDLTSVLPYPKRVPFRRMRMAMRIGREYLVWKIGRRHWERLAHDCALEPGGVVARVRELLAAVPDHLADSCRAARDEGLDHPVLAALADVIRENATRCSRQMEH